MRRRCDALKLLQEEFLMKKILLSCFFSALASSGLAADFSGFYKCELLDNSDGYFAATLALKLNPAASKTERGYTSYDIDFHVTGIPYPYTGIAAARGNDLALYFESTGENKNPDDRGVGIVSVVMDQDKSGREIVTLHKFYYEKSYKGSGNFGFENCTRVN